MQYAWSTSNTVEPSTWVDFANGSLISKTDITTAGTWYLWTNVIDKEGNRASEVKVSNGFTINSSVAVANQITLTQSPVASTWTNGNVTVSASYGANLSQNRKLSCTGTVNTDYTINGSANVAVKTKGRTVTAEATDVAGNKVTKQLTVNNIDKTGPIISKVEMSKGPDSPKIHITVQDVASGIKQYKIYFKQKTQTSYGSLTPVTITPTTSLRTFIEPMEMLNRGKEYNIYVEVYDAVGNKSVSSTITYTREY